MKQTLSRCWRSRSLPLLVALCAAAALPACAPLLIGGAMVGGGMLAIDRRTTGAQVEDEAIELKAGSRIGNLATLGHVSVTSYNRMVLITGEVPTEGDRAKVEDAVQRMENVRSVVNELAIATNSEKPESLRSSGEGMTRVLGIALALANCQDGLLLIDFTEKMNIETEKINDLTGSVNLRLVGILALAEHSGRAHSGAIRAGEQIGSPQKNSRPFLPGHGFPGRFGP